MTFEFDKGSATAALAVLHKKERLNNWLTEGKLKVSGRLNILA